MKKELLQQERSMHKGVSCKAFLQVEGLAAQ